MKINEDYAQSDRNHWSEVLSLSSYRQILFNLFLDSTNCSNKEELLESFKERALKFRKPYNYYFSYALKTDY
jgi:hypothetical protein